MPGNIAFSILTYVLAVALGFFINYLINKLKISKANVSAAKIIDDATAKADNLVKEAILDANKKLMNLKINFYNVNKQLIVVILLFKGKKMF